ncbi:oligosaccharide flippase family protein, partial [Vibrio sp. MarTm2]|uniref:oligosaccharide flippase family protein n=1 Tax=Vibrio sp. MarTm2 TaxID=2998831 RepID=UPI0022CD333E
MLKSIFSTGSFNLASQLTIFCVEVLIARFLVPADFGAFVLALMVVEFLGVLAFKSYAVSFVQNSDAIDRDLNSIIIFLLVLSILLVVVADLSSNVLASYFGSELFFSAFKVMIFVLPIMTIEYLFRLALMKKQCFWQVGSAELTSVLIYSICAMILAINGFGYLSLVYSFCIRHIVKLLIIVFHVLRKYDLNIELQLDVLKKHLRMSLAMTVQSIFLFSTSNTDRYFVTLAAGASGVGLYSRALKLVQVPLNQIVRSVSSVLFVEFSAMQNDKKRVFQILYLTTTLLCLLFFPFTVIVIVYAELIVSLVYGSNWIQMVPLLQVLSIAATVSALSIVVGDLLKSQGVVYREIMSNAFSLLSLITCSLLLYNDYEVEGIAVSYVIAQMIFLISQVYVLSKVLNVGKLKYYRSLLIPTVISSVVGVFCYIILMFFSELVSFLITI